MYIFISITMTEIFMKKFSIDWFGGAVDLVFNTGTH